MKKKKKPTRQERTRQANKFMELLFANEVGGEALISIWTKQGGQHRFFDSCSDAAEYAIERARSKLDVYVGCCLYRNGISKGRGRAEDVVRITALWVDVDCDKESGFADKKAGLAWLRNLDLPPSMIVDSGGGYHGWWLLTESQGTSAGGEGDLPKDFIKCLQRNAEKSGAKLDSVGDLSRVLRIPGTFNRKQKPVRRVKLLKGKIRRYDLAAIEAFVESHLKASKETTKSSSRFISNGDISLQELRSAVQKLSNDRASQYRTWIKVGMGIHSAYPDEKGLELWIEFSKKTTRNNFDERACQEKWRTFDASGLMTAGAVIMMAKSDSGEGGKARDPHSLGREILQRHYRHDADLTLWFHNRQWWAWNGCCYRRIPLEELRASFNRQLRNLLDDIGDSRPLSKHQVADVLGATEGECLLRSDIQMPAWVGEAPGPGIGEVLAMANGLLDVKAAFEGSNDCLYAHTPKWFSPVRLEYSFEPKAECNEWKRFLTSVLPEPAIRKLLQEFMGYCVVSDTSFHKFNLLVGDGANGKSVITDVTTSLLGEDNVSHIPLEQFGEQFALAETHGKLANIFSEIGRIKNIAEHNLKAIVSGDRIKVEHKYQDAFSLKPTIRLIFATNEVPKFHDRSRGIWRRMLLIPFDVSIPEGEQDRTLSARIRRTELPGILNWALQGLARLRRNDGFTAPQATTDAILKLRAKSNPVLAFILAKFEKCETGKVGSHAAYAKYLRSCENKEPLSRQQFGKEIRSAFPGVKYKQSRTKGGRGGYYQGMRKIR